MQSFAIASSVISYTAKSAKTFLTVWTDCSSLSYLCIWLFINWSHVSFYLPPVLIVCLSLIWFVCLSFVCLSRICFVCLSLSPFLSFGLSVSRLSACLLFALSVSHCLPVSLLVCLSLICLPVSYLLCLSLIWMPASHLSACLLLSLNLWLCPHPGVFAA